MNFKLAKSYPRVYVATRNHMDEKQQIEIYNLTLISFLEKY